MGESKGVNSVRVNCPRIEWNDSEELVEVGSFVCKRPKHLSDRVEIPSVFLLPSLFLQLFRSSLPWAITVLPFSLPLSLPSIIYLLLHLSICLCPIDHRLGDKARQPVRAEGFELLVQMKLQHQLTEEAKNKQRWETEGEEEVMWKEGEGGKLGLITMLKSYDIQLCICHFQWVFISISSVNAKYLPPSESCLAASSWSKEQIHLLTSHVHIFPSSRWPQRQQ